MLLPANFQFSQKNLQDFMDCPRRFELRYILRQPWPAVQSEPAIEAEKRIEAGSRFHRLVQQSKSGISNEKILSQLDSSELREWWQNYLSFSPRDLPPVQYTEFALAAGFHGFRLAAKYDLVAVRIDESLIIVDWKTSVHRPKPDRLLRTCQSRIYPLLLTLAGSLLNGSRPVKPELVSMVYWFANQPAEPIRFEYSAERFTSDQTFLFDLIDQVSAREKGEFELAMDTAKCEYCVYRSLCDRGVQAGKDSDRDDEMDDETEPEYRNLDSLPEIQF